MITQQQLVESLDKYYGLKAISVKVIDRLMFRQSFIVDSSKGNRYVVKDYSDTLSLHEMSKIWQYYWTLRNLGITVGCPLKKLNSDELYACFENRYYVVFEYVIGERPLMNQYNKIASCLKRYHEVASSDILPTLTSTGEKLEDAKKQFLYFSQVSYSIKREILSCKTSMYRIIDEYSNSSQTIIHGDSILENMISNNGEISLIDFDSIRRGDAIEDVANTVLSFMYYGSNKYEVHPERLTEIKAFIDSYYENRATLAIEEALHYYMQVHCVIELTRHAKNIRFLERMPGMKDYLRLLIHVIRSGSLNELLQKEYL